LKYCEELVDQLYRRTREAFLKAAAASAAEASALVICPRMIEGLKQAPLLFVLG
jgi:hypothetical protein